MPTLYRDYRPQKFTDILGQNHLKITLQNELAQNKLGQAYLFCGPRAVGKTTMARVLAQAVNCENRQEGDFEPCGECRSCQAIRQGSFLDVMEIDAASNTGVDNVRENIISSARLAPVSGKMKVFIIDEVHMLSVSAFNALLKILEEPPRHVLFILCTTELHKVPSTVVSRCQRFDFKRISPVETVKKLSAIASNEGLQIDREVLEDIARQSAGHLRDAESLLGQVIAIGSKKIGIDEAELVLPRHHYQEALDLIESLSKRDTGSALLIINRLADGGVNFKNFIEEVLVLLRKIMIQSVQPGLAEKLGLDFGDQIESKVAKLSLDFSLSSCLKALKRISLCANEKNQFIAQLPLEIAVAELCLLTDEIQPPSSFQTAFRKIAPEQICHLSPEKSEIKNITQESAADLSEEEVSARWPEVLLKIKKHNHSLSFVLQNCIPGRIINGKISLCFKYKFHRDRILDAGIKPITESTLAEVFGGRVSIEASLDENLELSGNDEPVAPDCENQPSPVKNSALGELLTNFGGESVG